MRTFPVANGLSAKQIPYFHWASVSRNADHDALVAWPAERPMKATRLMQRRPPAIRKAEVERTVKGVLANGLQITRIEVEGGKLVIYTGDGAAHQESPLETWRRKNG
jgi:hypothetical protein